MCDIDYIAVNKEMCEVETERERGRVRERK